LSFVSLVEPIPTLLQAVMLIDSKLHFHYHVGRILSQCIKLLGLDSLYVLCPALVTSKFQCTYDCTTVVRNSFTTADVNKLDRIQQKFAALSYDRFLPHVRYIYVNTLECLKLHNLT
jgi:hypothetical protein